MPKKPAKRKVTGGMRVDAYTVLDRAVEEGIAYGWRRAHKHVASPDEAAIQAAIQDAVMNSIAGVFKFDDGNED